MSDDKIKDVDWCGDSLDVIREWPDEVRFNIGADIRRLQEGKKPLDWKPFSGLVENAFELRDSDESGWYRAVYVTVIKGVVTILHCFEKDSDKTSRRDVTIANTRLKELLHGAAEKKKKVKRKEKS